MPAVLPGRFFLLRLAALLASAFALSAAPAGAAPLAPVQIDAVDVTGDATYLGQLAEAGVDITGFSILQDREAKVVRGTVTFNGAVAEAGLHELRIGLGLLDGYSGCNVSKGFGWVHIRHDMGTNVADYVISTMTDIRKDVAVERTGNTVSFVTPAGPGIFDGGGFRCIVVTTERLIGSGSTDFAHPEDRLVGYAPEVVETPNAVVDPGNGKPAPILDADGDGVHDGVDVCPKQAGAATNGCETAPLAKSIRLGTKRVVIDRLLTATSETCPKTVKIAVTLKGKSVGRQTVGTIKKGKFCHVSTVVPLKKRVAKARVVIGGAGVTSVAASVAK